MVQLIYGNEPYLIREHVLMMKNGAYDDMSIIETDVFDENTVYELNSFSLTGRKLVILELSELTKNETLEEYIKEPNEDNDLLVVVFGSVNKNLKVFKAFEQSNVFEKSKLPYKELANAVFHYLQLAGVTMERDAWFEFSKRINYEAESESLFDVYSELEKLIGYTDNRKITADMVSIVEKRVTDNAFVLTKLLFEKRAVDLREQLDALEKTPKFSSIGTLSLILATFKRVYRGEKAYGCTVPDCITTSVALDCMGIILSYIRGIKSGTVPSQYALRYCMFELMAFIHKQEVE